MQLRKFTRDVNRGATAGGQFMCQPQNLRTTMSCWEGHAGRGIYVRNPPPDELPDGRTSGNADAPQIFPTFISLLGFFLRSREIRSNNKNLKRD